MERTIVEFTPNVPVEVALKYAGAGKIISTRNGDRVMYTLQDERVMFLDLGPAQRINELGINVREVFTVTKRWSGKRNEAINWEVARLDQPEVPLPDPGNKLQEKLYGSILVARASSKRVGEQPDGTFAVPIQPETGSPSKVPPPPAVRAAIKTITSSSQPSNNGNSNGNGHAPATSKPTLVDEANALVDAYAQVLDRALTTYQGRIKPEEARALLISAYIQRGKCGVSHVA